ncbi:CC0125/CC1285 family lipoprotein [Brevundimonas vesicularis]|uniref:CC0125/CC1285 family lipoprotein n=1 Tax=Brevundimonas vesicularis TaxID=41276 RepID=UPI0038D3B5A5
MKRLTISLIAASALVLTGCASLAPYGPQMTARGQGYSELRIEQDRFRVTYSGVGAPGPVADRALYRAAQLTLEQGYDWFEVTQRWVDGRPDSAGGVQPSVSIGAGSSRYGGWSSSGVGVGLGLNLSGPSATSTTLEIVMGRGAMSDRREAYNARSVIESIGYRL